MAKKETQSREPTKRQIAVSRREKEQQKTLYMGLGLVVALVAIVLAIGLVQTYVIEPNSPVGSVNGQEITTRQYQDRVRYERFVLEDQYQQIVQELQALPPADENDQFSGFLRGQYEQLANQVLQQRSMVDRQTFDNMTLERLIEAEADSRGLTVAEDEITESINRLLAGRRGGLTALAVQETSTAAANAEATAALWTPTPTFTPSPTLTSTQATTQPVATPANTPTPAPTPTPNIIGQTDLSSDYTNWINLINEQTGNSEAQYRSYIRLALLRGKLRDALGEETPKTAEQKMKPITCWPGWPPARILPRWPRNCRWTPARRRTAANWALSPAAALSNRLTRPSSRCPLAKSATPSSLSLAGTSSKCWPAKSRNCRRQITFSSSAPPLPPGQPRPAKTPK